MKKLIATLIFTLLLLTIALSVAYYVLFRPYENIDPGDQIAFQDIEPSDAGIYLYKPATFCIYRLATKYK